MFPAPRLALAVVLGCIGVWRGYVRTFGTLDEHWLLSIVPEDRRPAAAERVVEERRQEADDARRAADPEKIQKAADRLKAAEEQRDSRVETWQKVVSRSYKLEGVICLGCLLTAACLGRVGWRRMHSPRTA